MKIISILGGLLLLPILAQAQDCYAPKLARDAIRAIALVSDRSMITDMVGGGSGEDIWANYRNHGYSDHYQVKIDLNSCRVLDLHLVEANGPIKEPN
jgi:hypothetical protein